jgi:rhodanese-related sulfurtransferase
MGWELAGFELERSAHRWPPPVSAGARERAAAAAGRIAAEDGVAFVTPAELRALVARRHEETLYVLDVRTGEEYAEGHVAGAVWAPGGQAIQAVDEYVAVRAGRIVCVCDGLVRSVLTASWLGRMGFPRVAVLRGGVAAWRVAGGAIEEGQPGDRPFGYEAARAVVPQVPPGSLDDAVVLSVDGSDAYARGHVPGAAWLCRSRLEWTVPQVMPDRGASLLVTCTDGTQSTLAAATLVGLGYRAARVLAGGTAAWRAAGLPVETGLAHLLDEPDDVVPKPYDRGREAMIAYLRWEEALTPEGQSPHALLPG